MPRVSVIVPVHDAEPYLRDCLESLSHQTSEDFEIVAVDDGSTDGSGRILDEYRRHEPRLRVLAQPHRGTAVARDAAIAAARGELLAFHDADDLAVPTRVAHQVAFLDAHPEIDVVGGALRTITADGHLGRPSRPPQGPEAVRAHLEQRFRPAIAYVTLMVRRTAWDRIGGHRPVFRVGQDQDALMRLLPARMDNITEVVTLYRRHPRQATQRERALVVYAAVMIKASHHRRRRGLSDPVDAWDGTIDPDLLLAYDTDPYLLAYLYAGLLTSGAAAGAGAAGPALAERDAAGITPDRLRARLAALPIHKARLSGPVGMLLQAVPLFVRAGEVWTAVRFAARVLGRYPGESLWAFREGARHGVRRLRGARSHRWVATSDMDGIPRTRRAHRR